MRPEAAVEEVAIVTRVNSGKSGNEEVEEMKDVRKC